MAINAAAIIKDFPQLTKITLNGSTDYRQVSNILVGAPNAVVWAVINELKKSSTSATDWSKYQ